jgi:hypothetical protein
MDIDSDDPVMLTRENVRDQRRWRLRRAGKEYAQNLRLAPRSNTRLHQHRFETQTKRCPRPSEKFDQIVANALRETKRDMRRLETMTEDQAPSLLIN